VNALRLPILTTGFSRLLHAGFAIAFLASLVSCSKNSQEQMQRKPGVAPVKAAVAAKKDVPLRIDVVGNIEAYSMAILTAQVGGQIEKIHFREGAFAKKDDILITIDPRPYKAAVAQAEAVLARDTVQADNTKKDAERYGELVAKGFIAQSQYDQAKTAADAAGSVVVADKAAVENAKLQLGYCYIHSPINGQTGAILINEGNLVKANDKTLATVYQVKPIYASFSVPQIHLPDIRKYRAMGRLKVTAQPPTPDSPPVEGVLTFIDNGVDPATGTIKLKATFDNGEKPLWPGQFVKISILLTTEKDVVVIPSQAVMTSQKGQYVFLVTSDGVAEMKPVTVSRTFDGQSIIATGVEAGQTVITDGQLQAIPGGKVKIVENQTGEKASGK